MPPVFKAAARTLLLAAHRGAGGGAARQPALQALGALPPAVLLDVLRLAAAPLTAWVALGE